MSSSATPTARAAAAPWTCPFCPLLCDDYSVDVEAPVWTLSGSDCRRARDGLSRCGPGAPPAQASVDGDPCSAADALAAAARLLAASRQPLFGGLGTDVAGARALYPLACRTGAICDPAGGGALLHGLRALQDRGAFTTTLAEVRTRADLIVCFGGLPTVRYPEFLRRCGIGEGSAAQVVVLKPLSDHAGDVERSVGVETVQVDADAHALAALWAACVAAHVAGRESAAPAPLVALAARLQAARYAVLVYETSRLPAHGALIVEALNRVVATLNQRGRAAALPLGGDDGASTVNAVFAWLSGLPLRTRASPGGLEHEPLRFDAARLIADRAVDALLWIASFGTEPAPPPADLPRIVLGHPSLAAAVQGPGTIYLPVATPGIGSDAHLFRTDGSVLMPLRALRDDGLPSVAHVLRGLTHALQEATA